MATNNGWNQGNQASSAQAIAGTDTRAVISPSTLQNVMNVARNQVPWCENLGIKYASSTFSVVSSDGSNLSSTNYAKVSLPSNAVPGQIAKYTITANQSFIDDTGASTIIGNTFGTNLGVAWPEIAPFFLYVAGSDTDTNATFFVARVAGRHHLPPATAIGQSGSAIADIDNGFFALAPVTAANYAGSACVQVGSFKMASKSAADDWTVATLDDEDGIHQTKDDDWFVFPTGQKGAAAGKYLLSNGGTAPTFATQTYQYSIQSTGICYISIILSNTTGGTAGSGAGNAQISLPFTSLFEVYNSVMFYTNNVTSNICMYHVFTTAFAEMIREGSGAILTNSSFSNATRAINGSLYYRIGETT